MCISDAIAAYILGVMERTGNGTAELQRNTLAEELGCVPSQISYVLTSRFTPEKGYIVESRRGGGGYIRIQRVRYQSAAAPILHTLNAIGEELAAGSAQAILENLLYEKCLTAEQARIMAAALSDKAYRDIPAEQRDRLRAAVMKQMLAAAAL